MIEVVAIISQLFFFLIIFSFPFTPKILNNFFVFEKKNLNLIDAHGLNVIFFIYFCLIFSFFNFDLKILFKIYFLLALFFTLINFKKITENININDVLKFIIFLMIVISIFFSIAQSVKLEWDGFFWMDKVLVFKNGEDIENLSTHSLTYPHLGSYLWAFFWKNSLIEIEYFGRLFYTYFYIVSIFLIFNISIFNNKNLKILILFMFIILTYEPYLLSGYQEYLIFSTLLIASRFILLLNFNNSKETKLIFLIFLILYLLCWFKNEGTVYFIIFFLSLIFFLKISNQKKFLFFLSIPILMYIKLILENNLIGIANLDNIHKFDINFLFAQDFQILLIKIFKIIYHTIISFLKHPIWLLIISSIIYFMLLINSKLDKKIKYFTVCILLNFGFIFTIFLNFSNIDFMLGLALDRLLFQTSGFYAILVLIFFNNLKLFKK